MTKSWPWPAPKVDDGAKHLIAGTRLPDVALVATRGAPVNLARFQERAVVFIYPFTGAPGEKNPPRWDKIAGAHGSTAQAEGFRDAYGEYQLRDFEVFGVSAQPPKAQAAFAKRAGLPFQLLSDENFAFAEALGLPRFETGGVAYLSRLTLIVKNSVIYRVFYPVHPPDTHARTVLAALTPAPT
ncbi:MAG: peroxiredoxin [Hyphomicrobium sp.]